jgi:hypothetical protein
MGRIHGRRGRVYMGLASDTAAAEPIAFLRNWSLNQATDKVDQTAMGDNNKIYTAGLPDASGEFTFWYDDTTVQTYQAARDGLPRRFYLYPSISNNGQYWWGTVLPDFNVSGAVDGGVEGNSSWNAASDILKVG